MGTRSVRRTLLTAALLGGLASGSLLASSPPATAAAPPVYTVVDLGSLVPGGTSSAAAINNLGVVAGTSATTGNNHAVRWSATGVITDLGTFPGTNLSSGALAINDAGQVAGYSGRAVSGYAYPARWSPTGAVEDLGGPILNRLGRINGLDPAGRGAGGQRAAGSQGDILGVVYNVDGSQFQLPGPPVGSGTTTTTSVSGAGLPEARAINSRGQVVGGGYLWQAGRVTALPALTPGASGMAGLAINVGGRIAGTAYPLGIGPTHAALWDSGTLTDLGTFDATANTVAKAINAAGQVVGTTDPACSPCDAPHAWLRNPGGTITALDSLVPADSGWSLTDAAGINDLGQIVGTGIHDGVRRAFLLTPTWRLSVNFAPAGAVVPPGYVADTGAVFGPRDAAGRLRFGWNADNSANTRERNAAEAPDQRYDTFAHLQKSGGDRTWELAVPNGTYLVHAVSGDSCCTDSTFRLSAEGRPLVSGTPTADRHWLEGSVLVPVTDGRLTIGSGPGAVNNKIDYLDVIAS